MKKIIFTLVAAFLTQQIFAQMGMLNFQQDLSGSTQASSGTGVPIDGGISTMIVGSIAYGYRLVKKKRNQRHE